MESIRQVREAVMTANAAIACAPKVMGYTPDVAGQDQILEKAVGEAEYRKYRFNTTRG
jgi:hypothetical protein